MSTYERSLPDELNWNQINQLHNATSVLSKQSFEIKKICLTLEIASLTLMAKFSNNTLDYSFFIAGLIIPFTFYILDVMTYFYQDRLREKMIIEENKIRVRNDQDEKINDKNKFRFYRSIKNSSHLIYLVLIIIDTIVCYKLNIICI